MILYYLHEKLWYRINFGLDKRQHLIKKILDKNLHIAIKAAIEAGKEIMKIYEKDDFSVVSKSDNSPLTIADIESNKIITNHLSKTNVPILSEEGNTFHTKKEVFGVNFGLLT